MNTNTNSRIADALHQTDWTAVANQMNDNGYAIIPRILTNEACDDLKGSYTSSTAYRKTIVMERYRFGLGEYKYFNYPLPTVLQQIRSAVYPHLATIANAWWKVLGIEQTYPPEHKAFLEQCHSVGQQKPTALILKYGKGGHNTLHQDLYGDVWFPMQVLLFLSEPEQDYTGGEFVMTQQTPRAQSKAIVLKPRKGDMLIFTTNFRPVKGSKGYYRANMKHGVSELHSGERYTLGIIFHDALS